MKAGKAISEFSLLTYVQKLTANIQNKTISSNNYRDPLMFVISLI
jgi:hypothetical protein